MASMYSGRMRRKSIRRMAREGPVRANARYLERRERRKKIEALNAPDVLIAHFKMLEHDAAEGVRAARSTWSLDSNDARSTHNLAVRELLAEKGHEFTPDELVVARRETCGKLRAGLEAKGWPMPRDDTALVELLKSMKPAVAR